jgi:hypothetical protein
VRVCRLALQFKYDFGEKGNDIFSVGFFVCYIKIVAPRDLRAKIFADLGVLDTFNAHDLRLVCEYGFNGFAEILAKASAVFFVRKFDKAFNG